MNYNTHNGFLAQIPPVTRNILIVNILLWVVMEICLLGSSQLQNYANFLQDTLGLHYWGAANFNPAQIFTYMFMHDANGIMHIFFNMFALWMFGRLMEISWGSKRFLLFYMVCGVGAALIQEVVWSLTWESEFIHAMAFQTNNSPEIVADAVNRGLLDYGIEHFQNSFLTVGASGAIFGILLGFAFTFPNAPLYFFFIPVPIKAKYMVLGYAVLELFLGVSGAQVSVAHFAHLGGMIFALPILLYWKKKGLLRRDFF